MNNKIYSLMALGAILFAAACSDNVSPISGSTSVPNMDNNLNIPQSPVLCSVIGVTDSLEAQEKGCIWSPEMWGPTTGYRVRTGYDNGTNTSGIWTVSTFPENAVVMEWPGNATTEYDSMALADVIDKCGGSLCGKVLFKGENWIPGEEYHSNTENGVNFDFYLAGKDASGKFESADVRDMGGICVSYSGIFHTIQLIPDDSLAALMGGGKYSTFLFSKTDSIVRACYPWDAFVLNFREWEPGMVYPLREDVLAHLKGFRFVFGKVYDQHDHEREFEIVGISRYNTPRVSTNNLHPVQTDCEPVSVTGSFCECDFSEDRISIFKGFSIWSSFLTLEENLRNDNVVLSDPVKTCLDSTLEKWKPFLDKMFTEKMEEKPCDNPLPKKIMCSDGTESESVEYAEIMTEYNDELKDVDVIADSLFNYCMSL